MEFKPYFTRQSELSVEGTCVLWGHRVVIPLPVHKKILQDLHTGHMGMSRMKALARSFVWWPCLDSQIESVVRCQDVHCAPPATSPRPWTWPKKCSILLSLISINQMYVC